MVEALTIVLAVGHTRGWRSALEGSAAALAVLTLFVAVFGPTLVTIPINSLRLVVGAVLDLRPPAATQGHLALLGSTKPSTTKIASTPKPSPNSKPPPHAPIVIASVS
jgi:hypothetical protein